MIPVVFAQSRQQKLHVLVVLAAWLMLHAEAVSEDTVSIKDILQTWEKTAVSEVRCQVVERVHMPGIQAAAFGSQVMSVPETNRQDQYHFAFIFGHGMRLDDLSRGTKENSTTEGGIRVTRPQGGVTRVFQMPRGRNNLLMLGTVGSLMCWLAPGTTSYGQELRSIARAVQSVSIVESNGFGALAHIELPSNTRLTLSKRFNWRPLAAERGEGYAGSPFRREFEYEWSRSGDFLILKSWRFVGELGGMKSETAGDVSDVHFSANLSDIQLAIPGRSLVRNVATNDEYLVKSDGNKRPILDTERANRIHLNTLLTTEPGEAVRAGPASYLAWWIMALGLAILATGVGLAFWRSAKIS